MTRNQAVFLLFAILLPAASHAVGPDPEIREIIGNVDAGRIGDTIRRLEAFGTRQSCSVDAPPGRGVNAARDWIAAQFSAIPGLQVRLDPFTHPTCPAAPTFNVIAWLPGTGPHKRLVVIGGHYDTRTIDVNDSVSDAPGANDAGSQAALVLEAAHLLAGHSFDATFVFVTFSGEEQGLFGSGELAQSLDRYFSTQEVVAMLNSDIVGGDTTVNGPAELQQFRLYSPGAPRETLSTHPDGTTDNTSPSRGLMRAVGTWGAAYVPEMQMLPKLREDRPGRGSDHRSFIVQAFPAVRFMETFECSPSPVDNSCGAPLPCPPPARIPASCRDFSTSHQHSPQDISAFVTPEYTARIAKVLLATGATVARAPPAPHDFSVAKNAAGVTASWSSPSFPVDHYVVAARSTAENFYRQRVSVPGADISRSVLASELGLPEGQTFLISVAAVDAQGHESLFAYPEFRCDATACAVPPGATDPAAPAP
jgi:acetylornithine deacetylase/succinyl-diaminopimelate desuccinylase-like protein